MKLFTPLTVSLTFDDGFLAHAQEAAPRLEARGWHGAFNVPTDFLKEPKNFSDEQLKDLCVNLDQAKMMSWRDVRHLLSRGHEVYPHTCSHVNLQTLLDKGDDARAKREIEESCQAFVEHLGVKPKFFCAPHNTDDSRVRALVSESGTNLFECNRFDFGGDLSPEIPQTVGEYLILLFLEGATHVDLSIHGVSRELGGWRPFENMSVFENYLDQIKSLERYGIVQVVDYASVHTGKDGTVRRKPRKILRLFRRLFWKVNFAPMLLFMGLVALTGIAEADCLDELLPRPREIVRGAQTTGVVPNVPGGYRLSVKDGKPSMKGFDQEGMRYAKVTWGQLKKLAGKEKIPDCTITDWPEFKYRGLLLDCGRNYQSVESIRDFIDHLAKYKYNIFHWHIADDYGWRLESKKHPELQSEKAFGRQVGKFYTQKEFVETVRYAKKRGVTVILELDMPGHTLAFRCGTGFASLAAEEAKVVLGELIDEVCALLPKDDLPIIHLGTDEAREPGEKVPQGHLDYWAKKVTDNGRILMGWSPGLKLPGQSIKHLWRGATDPRGDKCAYIDSQNLFYINHVDCEAILSVAAYQKPCRWGSKEEQLGAIVCVWHDDNIADTEDVARMNFVYPALVLLSDSFWNGCSDEPDLYGRLPRIDDPRFARAADLERRTLAQRDKVLKNLAHPFPYVGQTDMRWKMTDATTGDVIATDIPQATVYPQHFWYPAGSYVKNGNGKVILETTIVAPKDIDCGAWIGMTGFSRSDGRSRDGRTPRLGEWNKHGATIEINGIKIDPPKWTHPGVGGNPKEQPLVDEDYWYRAPTKVHLKVGENRVKMTLPKNGGWKWIGTFIPVFGDSDHPREIEGLKYISR